MGCSFTFDDEEGLNPAGIEGVQVTVDLDYDFSPGCAPVYYDRNGDGHPGEPPSVEINCIKVTEVHQGDTAIRFDESWDRWAKAFIEKHCQEAADEACFEVEGERHQQYDEDYERD